MEKIGMLLGVFLLSGSIAFTLAILSLNIALFWHPNGTYMSFYGALGCGLGVGLGQAISFVLTD